MSIRSVIVHQDKKKLWALERILNDDKKLSVVAVFLNSDEAMKFLKTQSVNIVILADKLDHKSGHEFIIELMKIKPIACLLLTEGDTFDKDLDTRALEYGIVDTHEIEYFNSTIIHGARIQIKVKILSKLNIERFSNQINQVNNSEKTYPPTEKGRIIDIDKPTRIISTPKETLNKVDRKISKWLNRSNTTSVAVGRRFDSIVILGASTGGPSLLDYLISQLPQVFPPVIVIQHMPKGFVAQFAARLNSHSKINVKMAEEGDRVLTGNVYVAPGGYHLEFAKVGKGVTIHITDGPKVNFVKPAVDVTLKSAAKAYGNKVVAAILTGMGSDGREGSKIVKQFGGSIIALNEQDSVIFGMNKSVIDAGLADVISGKRQVIPNIIRFLS